MDISQIPDILTNAAIALGPAGATVMDGALSAAGESIFNTIKEWFKRKPGNDVSGALDGLRQTPNDAGKQTALRTALEAQAAPLSSSPDTAELLRLCAALHVLTAEKPELTVQWTKSGINIGRIEAEKSLVIHNNKGDITF